MVTVEEATFVGGFKQETPTHVLHNHAVPVKCQKNALIQMTSL